MCHASQLDLRPYVTSKELTFPLHEQTGAPMLFEKAGSLAQEITKQF